MPERDVEYEELIAQPYANCVFSSGFVTGHPVDTVYLRLTRDGDAPTTILLRPDEAAALAWCLTGVLWSERMRLDGHATPVSAAPPSVFVAERRAAHRRADDDGREEAEG